MGLVVFMSVPAFATELTIQEQTQQTTEQAVAVNSFSDVKSSHWAYKPIMAMVRQGLFSGTSKPVNGVGVFDPDKTMTRAEFVTVVVRAMYPNADTTPTSGNWYSGTYDVAVDNGLIKETEFSEDAMAQSMTRQEMAMVLVRAAEQKGETPSQLIDTSRIADYSTVGTYYRDYVRKAYSMGMICGVDDNGTYAPKGTLNRDAGATVLYRLVEPSTRIKVDFNAPSVDQNQAGAITIKEGQLRSNRPAREGDIFVKADGTKVVLKKDQYGIVGGGQGVAPDIGLYLNGTTCADNDPFSYDARNTTWVDSVGKNINNQTYYVNRTTGSGHWGSEIQYLESKIAKPSYEGKTNGEVSKDAYAMYKWSERAGIWRSNF